MTQLHVVDHPLIADAIRQLRDERTPNGDFLRLAGEITRYLAYEAFRSVPVVQTTVNTPVMKNAPAVRVEREYLIVPILRAGLGMSPAVQAVLPRHRVCLMGLRRNEETLQPDLYLDGLPDRLDGVSVVICDPMLATGGSLIAAIELLKSRGAADITALVLIASQPGVDLVSAAHPDVRIAAAALDPILNDVGYITPGLGDAGDRLFGPPAR
ncbi:MAG: uracil phosphoribosyltransferase [Actinomycetes bacterium]